MQRIIEGYIEKNMLIDTNYNLDVIDDLAVIKPGGEDFLALFEGFDANFIEVISDRNDVISDRNDINGLYKILNVIHYKQIYGKSL